MKEQYEARMLRIYFGESDRWQGRPLQQAIIDTCLELGISGVIIYRGIEGFGSSTRVRRDRVWKLSRDAPMMAAIIETEDKMEKLIPRLENMVGEGLMAISRVEAIRYSRGQAELPAA